MDKPLPYQGSDPYIFFSYSHRNEALTFEIIRQFQKQNYRTWYDDGIYPGIEWPETIAQHIAKSSVFIALISSNSLQSVNCKKEINFAISRNLPIIFVLLEEVELPLTLQMELSSIQAVKFYDFSNMERFMDKITQLSALSKCRIPVESCIKEQTGKKEREKNGFKEKLHGFYPKVCSFLKKYRTLLAVLLSVILLGGGYFIYRDYKAFNYDPETMYKVILTPPEDTSITDFYTASDILYERLKILCGNKRFKMDIVSDQIHLQLPKEAFGDLKPQNVFQCYLTRKTALYMNRKYVPGQSETSNEINVPIDRNAIESVSLKSGHLNQIPPESLKEMKMPEDNYPYIELTLTDEAAEKYADTIHTLGDDLQFAQDCDIYLYFYYTTFAKGDGKTFYIINNDLGGHFNELVYYNFTHDTLPFHFSFEIAYTPEWQSIKNLALKGKMQCDRNDLSGNLVTFAYWMSPELSSGSRLDAETALKERMDALGRPYAFGLQTNPDASCYAIICTDLSHVGIPIFQTLAMSKDAIKLCSDWDKTPLYGSPKLVKSTDAYSGLILSFNESLDIHSLIQSSENADKTGLYLTLNDVPFFQIPLSSISEDEKTIFMNTTTFSTVPFDPGNTWLSDYILALYNGNPMESLTFSGYQFDSNQSGSPFTSDDFGVPLSTIQKELIDQISDIAPESITDFSNNTVTINLNLSFDEHLPEKSLELVQKILEDSDFKESPYSCLYITPVKTSNVTHETFSFYFTKSNLSISGNTLHLIADCKNGRFQKLQDIMKNGILNDPYFKQFEGHMDLYW